MSSGRERRKIKIRRVWSFCVSKYCNFFNHHLAKCCKRNFMVWLMKPARAADNVYLWTTLSTLNYEFCGKKSEILHY